MKCQICSNDIEKFLDLGKTPPCDFLTESEFSQEAEYPLNVYYCPTCGLVQLGELVNQKTLFTPKVGYHHIAALSSSFREHLDKLAEETKKRFNLTSDNLMVEIGSNDGALLESFRKQGVKILGVDPTDVTKIAIDKGLTTITEWFNEKLAEKIKKEYGKAKIITAINTFAHVSSLDSVVRGIDSLLTNDGVFISENHYVLDLIKDLQYDFIYHEHQRYYSLRSLIYLFNKFNMDVFDVEHIPTHSGSIRVFACKRGSYPINDSVRSLLKEEEEFGLNNLGTYKEFSKKVKSHKEQFVKMLSDIRKEGKTIMGLTFPARAVTLLKTCNIGPETIDAITELSTLKIGKFSPGTHIKVVDQKVLFGDNAPDYGLLLSWHIRNEIIPRFREKGFKGKFIIPLPAPVVID